MSRFTSLTPICVNAVLIAGGCATSPGDTHTLYVRVIRLSEDKKTHVLPEGVVVNLIEYDPAVKTASIRLSSDPGIHTANEGEHFGNTKSVWLDRVSESEVEISFRWCEWEHHSQAVRTRADGCNG